MKDWRGTEITKGARCIWMGGYDRGSMREGIILDFEEKIEVMFRKHWKTQETIRYEINRSWVKVKNQNGNTVKPNWDRVTII